MAETAILIVDDNQLMVKFLSAGLAASGYRVRVAGDGKTALQVAAQETFDLILLDIMMPDIDGEEVCRRIREWSKVPIIMITAKAMLADKVRLLDMGADDYITKPFGVEELLARVRAVLRRSPNASALDCPQTFTSGDLQIDFTSHRVLVGGKEVHLTPIEYDLLRVLALNADKVVTHRDLLFQIWGGEFGDTTEYLRTHIRNVRLKIEADPGKPRHIQTRNGVGYFLRTFADGQPAKASG